MRNSTNKLTAFYKALSHPARLEIITKLLTTEACICKDFVEELEWAQPTISEHLNKLKKVGLISLCEKGTTSEYCLNRKKYEEFLILHSQFNLK